MHTLYIIVGYSIQPQNTHTTVRPVSAAPKIGNRAQSVAARLLENSLQYIVKCGAVWCGVQCSVVGCGVEYNTVWCDDCEVWSEEPGPLRDNSPPERDDTTQGLASLVASLQGQSTVNFNHTL